MKKRKRLFAVSISAMLILGGLVACSSEQKEPEQLVPSSTQPQGVDSQTGEGGSGMESEQAPMTGDGMDSEDTEPSMGGSSESESTTDPTLSNETETGGTEEETSGDQEMDTPSEEPEGTDSSTGTTGS